MRITQGSVFTRMGYTFSEIQSKLDTTNTKIATGKEIQQLSDNPVAVGEIQDFSSVIQRNESFHKNIEESTIELQNASDIIENIANIVQETRLQALAAINPSNLDKLPVFATQVKNLLTDLVNQANTDLNGHFLFGGTKTTPTSITPVAPETNNLPFEIVQDAATATNPSGLRVAFKGNLEDRNINRSTSATETVNVKADELFGTGGVQAFQDIINLYNKLAYDSTGAARVNGQAATLTDSRDIQTIIGTIGNNYDNLNTTNSVVGEKINRMLMISEQIMAENTRLSALRSNREDTDMAKAALDMQRHQSAMQFSMQVGSKLIQQSLFDFLR